MLRVTKVLAALLVLVPIQGLAAQGSAAQLGLEGEKVRVQVAIESADASRFSFKVQGTFIGQHGDSIQVVEAKGLLRNLALSSVQSIDVRQGRDRWRGAGFGALIGAATGLLLSLIPPDCDAYGNGYDCRADGTGPTTVHYVADNLRFTVFLGTIIGFGVGTERWDRIMARPTLSVAPVAGGLGLRVSF